MNRLKSIALLAVMISSTSLTLPANARTVSAHARTGSTHARTVSQCREDAYRYFYNALDMGVPKAEAEANLRKDLRYCEANTK